MPLARTQSVLKRLLPASLFYPLYRVASYLYGVWVKASDAVYYGMSPAWNALTGNKARLRRVKTICRVLQYTMVGRKGLLSTYDIAEDVEERGIEGSFVECGVARGGCSALMALVAREHSSGRRSWLFDSFDGLPEQTEEDEYRPPVSPLPEDRSSRVVAPGYCLGTFEEVEDLLFNRLGLKRDNISMIKGWFQDTLPVNRDTIEDIAVLRIDGDWYESTRCCLENLYDNVVPGGFIIIDDYGSVVGCKKAVDEFIAGRGLDVRLSFDGRGGCYFNKPGSGPE